jgi:hypothetical protein
LPLGYYGNVVCDDCLRDFRAAVTNAPACSCASCRAGGFVIAIDWAPETGNVGRAPWCAACHHYISPSGAPNRK